MKSVDEIDLSELRGMWRRRREAAAAMRRRVDPRGMTRPPRAPEEREWLRERGERSVFVEVEEALEPAENAPDESGDLRE